MDVLKERICELTEKSSRLERENKIFRANATPETIQLVDQFAQQAQLQPRQSSPSQAQLTASLPPLMSNPVQPPPANTSPQTTGQQSTSAITTINTINTINAISTQPNPAINSTINSAINQQINQQMNQQINQQLSQQISGQTSQPQLNTVQQTSAQPAASNQPTANQLT